MRVWLSLFLLLSAPCFSKTIAIVLDGKEMQNSALFQTLEKELKDLLEPEYPVTILPFYADWSLESAEKELASAIEDETVDLIVTGGVLTSLAAVYQKEYPKPIVTLTIVGSSLNDSFVKPPIDPNYIYIKGTLGLLEDLLLFQKLLPIKRLTVVGDASYFSDEEVKKALTQLFKRAGVDIQVVSAIDRPEDVLESLENSPVLLFPLFRMDPDQTKQLIDGINKKRLPSFSLLGDKQVEEGILASTAPKSYLTKLARRVALNSLDLLSGVDATTLETLLPMQPHLTVNARVARALNIPITWEVERIATLIDLPPPPKQYLTNLLQTAEEALKANLDLNVERFVVLAGNQIVNNTKSALLPQITSFIDGEAIDGDRASRFSGSMPEFSIRGGAFLTQVIYDEDLCAAFHIARREQYARIFEMQTVALDVILDSTLAYLQVLRIKSLEEIEEQNLALTRRNLKVAEDRVASGEARKSEMYRWESQIASNQQTILGVGADRSVAENSFNRILHRDIHTPVVLQESFLYSPEWELNRQIFETAFGNPNAFSRLEDLFLTIALANSPEVKRVTQQMEARYRDWTAARRAYYVPKVDAIAEVSDRFYRQGAGRNFPPGVNGDHTDLSLGVSATYPLYTSGARRSRLLQAYYDVNAFLTEKSSTEERVAQRLFDSLDRLRSSYLSIELAKEAVRAAEDNLRIVFDSYARGVESIVDLIDAQNVKLDADREEVRALFDFLEDLMRMQRATGSYEFLLCHSAKQELADLYAKFFGPYVKAHHIR